MLIHKKKLKTTLVTILILVPIVSGIVMFLPTRAFACQCFQPSPPKEELQKAVAVFSGTVVGIDKKKVSVGQGFFEDSYTATFDVERAWKGVSKKTITVNAGIQGGMCGYPFEEKESYIVYADGADENELLTSLCTRTNKLIFAHEDLKELGEGTTEFVQNTVPELPTRKFDFFYYGGFNFWYYFGIGMFVVGLIAIIFIAFLLFKHKQSISVFLKRRFLLIVAFAASVIITGAAVYQITNLTLKQEQKQTLESMRSAFSEQIGDLKIENRKLKGTIETLEKAVPESPQACTSALTKSGDDPILQTIIEASPLIAHVKITSIGGGVVFKSGVAIFTAQAEITQLYKAPFQIKEDIQFNFDRFAYLSFEADEYSDFKKRRQAFQEPLRVEKDKEYIVFLKLPDGPLVNPNPTDEQFFYTLADRFLGAQPYDKYLEERVMQYASPPKIVTSLDENQCVDLAREVAAMLDEANYCAQDSDCMVFETHFRCDIIGCYAFVSKNTNRESIQKSISNYTKNGCPVTSDCLCAFPPKQQDVKCIANKCVDTRLPQ